MSTLWWTVGVQMACALFVSGMLYGKMYRYFKMTDTLVRKVGNLRTAMLIQTQWLKAKLPNSHDDLNASRYILLNYEKDLEKETSEYLDLDGC